VSCELSDRRTSNASRPRWHGRRACG